MIEGKRVLVVSANWLGDALLTTPVFKALKNKYHSSYLAVACAERVGEVFTANPYIDEVITFDERGRERGLLSRIMFVIALRRKKFETVFLIHRSFTRALICFFAGIKNRVGYRRPKNYLVLTSKIPPQNHFFHRQDRYLYLFTSSGVAIEDKACQFFIPQKAKAKARIFLKDLRSNHPFIVGVNPSANWRLKRWPESSFALLSDRLIEELNCAVVFTGAVKDEAAVERVILKMRGDAYNFCGKTNLKELGALIQGLNIFISNDSGPAHLAACLGVSTLVLFGPTSPEISAPRGRTVEIIQKGGSCKVPCYDLNCRENICMKNIGVEEVFLRAKSILLDKCARK